MNICDLDTSGSDKGLFINLRRAIILCLEYAAESGELEIAINKVRQTNEEKQLKTGETDESIF